MNRMENFWSDGTEIPARPPVIGDGGWARHDLQQARSERRPPDRDAAKAERPLVATTGTVSPVKPRHAPAIVLENLTKKYNSHFAVDDVSFFVPKGATLGLLGGNGAGKTTTIAMIMGLVIPTFGSARVLGHDMTYARHKVLGRMNFQSPYVAMPGQLTVRQNLEVFARLYNVREVKARIGELVEEFGLGDLLGRETRASLRRPEDPGGARQGTPQQSGSSASRRADRLARPRPGRMDSRPPAHLSGTAGRHDSSLLAQHAGGGAVVRLRRDHAPRARRCDRHTGGRHASLRLPWPGSSVHARLSWPRAVARGERAFIRSFPRAGRRFGSNCRRLSHPRGFPWS